MGILFEDDEYELLRLIDEGINAFRLTREYVEPEVFLPAKAGWEWYDWCTHAQEVLQARLRERAARSAALIDGADDVHVVPIME